MIFVLLNCVPYIYCKIMEYYFETLKKIIVLLFNSTKYNKYLVWMCKILPVFINFAVITE